MTTNERDPGQLYRDTLNVEDEIGSESFADTATACFDGLDEDKSMWVQLDPAERRAVQIALTYTSTGAEVGF